MKRILIFLFVLNSFSILAQSDPTLVDIPHQVFVNGGKNEFENILYSNNQLKDKVQELFEEEIFIHEHTKYSTSFENYWKIYQDRWHFIRFKEKEAPLLLFSGIRFSDDERTFVELYIFNEKTKKSAFNEVGNLLAYKIHPYTEELILYVHQYPCCRSASHNIHQVRLLNGEIATKDDFFVGRDRGDMVGPFFPDEADHSAKFYSLKEKTELRWSPAIVEENAFLEWTESNLIIHYNEGAIYKRLYDNGEWLFVKLYSGIAEESSMMLNYTNFINKPVYGWIKK